MSKKQTAFLFPGAGVKPYGTEASLINKYNDSFHPFFKKAAGITGIDLISEIESTGIENFSELKSQIFAYCFGSGMLNLILKSGLSPCILAGYSMGIYTALPVSGALSFETGVSMITTAFHTVKEETAMRSIGICAVIGLSMNEINRISEDYKTIMRINSNNTTCHIISGLSNELEKFIQSCYKADAINVLTLDIKYPYHNNILIPKTSQVFAKQLESMDLKDPDIPLISTIDQQIIDTKTKLKSFVSRHLSNPINWSETVSALYKMGYINFLECGHGISLTQNARFMKEYSGGWINIKNIENKVLS